MKRFALVVVLAVLAGLACPSPTICKSKATPSTASPLLNYISKPDSTYAWKQIRGTDLKNAKAIRIELTSQTWQGIVWKHNLDVVRPANLRANRPVLLWISGGMSPCPEDLAGAANTLQMPIAILSDIPNQPICGGKYEDALIAYTFSQCLATGDTTWPLLYPMTKSVVRAMDALEELGDQCGTPIKGFVVTGASKRGWTTWFAGAVDKRVIGIAPVVYDNLNLTAQMKRQIDCYGKYSEAISDYTNHGLPQMLNTADGQAFARTIDPYEFRDRLTMPKLILVGTNDPYWTLQSADLYYDDLIGDKHILYVPNGNHGIQCSKLMLAALGAFSIACAEDKRLPDMCWRYRTAHDSLRLNIRAGGVNGVSVWTAISDTRDFRKSKWEERRIDGKDGVYEFSLPRPESGYAAMFGEVTYEGSPLPFCLSTTPKMIAAE